jgi:hypothetical protein
MATATFAWDAGQGFDLHLLRGTPSPSLLASLVVTDDLNPNADPVPATGPGLPADFTGVTFSCDVQAAALAAQGITLDPATGRIDLTAMTPAAPVLRNFLVHAQAQINLIPSPDFVVDIRVHVHDSVSKIWLTPSALTVHVGADGLQFTVLAQFDDDVAGDVTTWTSLAWASSAPGDVQVDPSSGALKAATDRASPVITVSLPASGLTPALTASATVHAQSPWAAQAVEFVAGKGAAARGGAKNILFLSDGFATADKDDFQQLVHTLVGRLRHGMRPYDLLRDSVNYWQTFVASPQSGASILPEALIFTAKDGTQRAHLIPLAVKPDPAAVSWQLSELIYKVGLPVLADDPPGRPLDGAGGRLAHWQALYGPGITRDLVQNAYPTWLMVVARQLLNERDTAFGLGVGMRPNLHARNATRRLRLNPRRTTDDQFTTFVEKLTFGGAPVGTMWTTGDSKGLVCLISRTLQDGGSQFGVGFATTLAEQDVCAVTAAPAPRLGLDVSAADIAATDGWALASTTAHECAHALGLLDEYGSGSSRHYPAAKDKELSTVGNLEPLRALTGAAGLDGTKIKWLWPRISHAGGVLTVQPAPQGGGFQITLQAGHGAPFKHGDVARLRRRPLPVHPDLSGPLQVTGDPVGDVITVTPDPAHPLVPGDWPEGSVLLVPVPDPAGPAGAFLTLVAPAVRDYVRDTHQPLNGPAPPPGTACGNRTNYIQVPANLPAGLKPPKTKAFIVGVYEGGRRYDLDVYHPAGMCKMRSERTSCVGLTRFCQVCRYLLVDAADPSKHGALDAIYDPEYPR